MPPPRSPSAKTGSRADAALVLFAKAPIPGQVKTRLCPPLSPDEAASLHGSFVLDGLERSKNAIQQGKLALDRFVACAPSADHVFFKILGERHGVGLLDQVGDDLGTRMHQASVALFGRGYRRIVMLGTDLPSLPLTIYREALALLDRHDVVLGPAEDGGYYAIGLTRPMPELFQGIPWSTADVLTRTVAKAEALGLKVAYLSRWRDVDTLDDLQALIAEAERDARRPKRDQVLSMRTAGTLQLLGQRLRGRREPFPSGGLS